MTEVLLESFKVNTIVNIALIASCAASFANWIIKLLVEQCVLVKITRFNKEFKYWKSRMGVFRGKVFEIEGENYVGKKSLFMQNKEKVVRQIVLGYKNNQILTKYSLCQSEIVVWHTKAEREQLLKFQWICHVFIFFVTQLRRIMPRIFNWSHTHKCSIVKHLSETIWTGDDKISSVFSDKSQNINKQATSYL